MVEQMKTSSGSGARSTNNKLSDPRIRMVEHIVTHYDRAKSTDVRAILNETKVGAWRQPTLLKMIRNVLTES
jgi:hypothetical protein